MYSNKQMLDSHLRALACSALSELGLEIKAWEHSSPYGTIDMGSEAEECKQFFDLKVSFRRVQAVIVFQVSTGRDPITQKMNPA